MNPNVLARTLALPLAFGLLASAQAAPITFNSLTGTAQPNGYRTFASPLQTDGFTFVTDDPGSINFGTWTAQSDANTAFSNFTGSNALFSNSARTITMRKSDSTAFDVFTIDVAQIYRDSLQPVTITFQGVPAGGGTFAQTYALPLDRNLHTVSLLGFTNLTSLSITGVIPGISVSSYIQIDNINTQPVPEPATLGVLAVGGLVALRRRRAARA